jgi:hypothetical protein
MERKPRLKNNFYRHAVTQTLRKSSTIIARYLQEAAMKKALMTILSFALFAVITPDLRSVEKAVGFQRVNNQKQVTCHNKKKHYDARQHQCVF